MSENQKLREALRVAHDHIDMWSLEISHCKDAALIREALALPTAEQVDDINVAESFTSVTKTAPPVGERELFEREAVRSGYSVDKYAGTSIYADISTARAYEWWQSGRSALSAGDAVDGPLIDEGSKPALSPLSDKDAIALIKEHTNDDNVIHAHEAIDLIRSVERAHGIDAAMRKAKP